MTSFPKALDVDGPIRAEVFVVSLEGADVRLTGPCGPAPWHLELGRTEHPLEVVDRIVRDVLGPPRLVHSTSWRREGESIVLTFIVVVDSARVRAMESRPVARTDLARSSATAPPADVAAEQVVEHALRHLAWLAIDDPAVRDELPERWHAVLAGYRPEPFRGLG